MKKLKTVSFILFFLWTSHSISQDLPTSNFTENVDLFARGGNPTLDFFLQQFKNQEKEEVDISFEGSPFHNDSFKVSKIYAYEELGGEAYTRYDGFNDEVQIKYSDKDEDIKILLQRTYITVEIDNKLVYYKKYIDKRGNSRKGYLFEILYSENEFVLYQRNLKRYKEGKKAITSLEIEVPNKFINVKELYVEHLNEETEIKYLKTSKKEILKFFEAYPIYDEIKNFINDMNLNMRNIEEIKQVFLFAQNN